MSVDGLVTRKKAFSESINHIDKNIDVVVEVLKVRRDVFFELCLDGNFVQS